MPNRLRVSHSKVIHCWNPWLICFCARHCLTPYQVGYNMQNSINNDNTYSSCGGWCQSRMILGPEDVLGETKKAVGVVVERE